MNLKNFLKRLIRGWLPEEPKMRKNLLKERAYMHNPSIGKAALFRGAKAGAVSGVIYGAVQSPLINFAFWVYGSIKILIMPPLASIMVSIIAGVIGGLIFGLMFAALYDKLPGKTPTIKGIVVSIIYWVAYPLGLPLLISLYRWGFEGLYWFFSWPYNWMPTAIMLGLSIIWGWLLGRFWTSERFGKL